MIEVIAVVLVVILIGYMMVKKVNGAAALFTGGILLFVISALLGHSGFGSFEIESSGSRFYDILLYIDEIFKDNLTGSGLIIMALFGYSALMGVIGANEVAIDLLSRPLLRIGSRGRLFMIPLLYYVCSVMSLAVPSAASLAVLLMATLFPALVGAGMSPLGVGAVIATSAAIMPTPLAADAIASSKALGIDLGTYVFSYNARIALPATLVIGIAHMFWQQYCDKKDGFVPATPGSAPSLAEDSTKDEPSAPSFYALLPVLPLLLALVIYVLNMVGAVSFTVELLPITIVSVVVTLIVDMITRRTLFSAVDNLSLIHI